MQVKLPPMADALVELRLAEMLCTRLCHDITGPIGAVNNGVEFLREESSDLTDQAVTLIEQSAVQAVNRVRFYRQCYGRIKEGGETDLQELRDLCTKYYSDGRITLDWPAQYIDTLAYSLSRRMGKLLLNLVFMTSEMLIRGGKVRVTLERNGPVKTCRIEGEGQAVKGGEILKVLTGEIEEQALDPKTSQSYMTLLLASELEAALEYDIGETFFYITATRRS